MRRLTEFVRMIREGRDSDFDEAFLADVREMVEMLGYRQEDATILLRRQINFHASLLEQKETH
jgi:hypothetical protein